MDGHVVVADIGESMRRGGNAFLHILKDAAVVNSNLYGEHGEFPLSLESLMDGCSFYSNQHDSGGDIFALMLTSFLGMVPYFVYKAFRESIVSSGDQIACAINDTYLGLENQLDTTDSRHPIAKTMGLPGLVVGGLARTAIYGGGLFGLSSFGIHHAAKAFTHCINFICDNNDLTESHDTYLEEPRTIPATVIKHVNLVRVTNGLGYAITAACGVLGLTAHSMRSMGRGINAVNQVAFDYDIFTINDRVYTRYSKEWFAQAGLIGLAGIAVGSAMIAFAKTVMLTARFLGISEYSGHTIDLALKRCAHFVFGTRLDTSRDKDAINAHLTKTPQTLEDRADRSWFGINRLINGFAYSVSIACGFLGLTTHSMQLMYRGLNVVSETAFGKPLFRIYDDEQEAFDTVKLGSKEWVARAGFLGLANIALGTLVISLVKTVVLSARLIGISEYSGNTITLTFKQCANFIFGTQYDTSPDSKAIQNHKDKLDQTLEDRADRTWFGVNRLINGFAYLVGFTCTVFGFTTHSISAMRQRINHVNYTVFGHNVFLVQELTHAPELKEKVAQNGLLGLMGLALGTVAIGFGKAMVLTALFIGVSKYSATTIIIAFKDCANFILGNHHFNHESERKWLLEHRQIKSPSWENRADRNPFAINKLINSFIYTTGFTCAVLGLTAHSLRTMAGVINAVNQAAFGHDIFAMDDATKKTYNEVKRGSKEWFARAGLLGLMGIAIGTIAISFAKVVVLTARCLGISEYSSHTIRRAYMQCSNFIFATNYDLTPDNDALKNHVDQKPQTLENRADRSWLGINRLINGFAYAVGFVCGVLGFTMHSMQFMSRCLHAVNHAFFGHDNPTTNSGATTGEAAIKRGSKEWFAEAGLLGLAGIAFGSVTLCLTKTIVLTARFLGISDYSRHTMILAFKRCANFVFATTYTTTDCIENPDTDNQAIQTHLKKSPQTLEDRADRSWLGFNRLINGYAYSMGFVYGVLGLTTHSMQFMSRCLGIVNQAAFGAVAVAADVPGSQVIPHLGIKERLAQVGPLGLAGIALGTAAIGFAKVVVLTARFLGISNYSANTITLAFNRCSNFIFGNPHPADYIDPALKAIQEHIDKKPQILEDRADRSWFGINRLINGFAYSVSFACGVLGLTTHSKQFISRCLDIVNQAVFGAVTAADAPSSQIAPHLGIKERLAQAGLLGFAGIALGTAVIAVAKVVVLTARFLGISNYSANTIALTFKQCANFVFGTNYNTKANLQAIQTHKTKKLQTLEDRADRSWLGIHRIISGFTYAFSAALGVIGLTASFYHTSAKTIKEAKNMFADDNHQLSTKKHDDFLDKMAHQNAFTNFTSQLNLFRVSVCAVKYTLWGSASTVAFCLRRAWKLTFGNLLGNACGTDGTFRSTSIKRGITSNQIIDPVEKMNQRFRDLLWCLKPNGDLPEKSAGESPSYDQAILDSKQMGLWESIKWRAVYEVRKSASIFSLNSIAEKVILHFAATFKEYIRDQRIHNPTFATDNLAPTFFRSPKCRETVDYIKTHYGRDGEKQAVEEVVAAIEADIVSAKP